MPTTAGSSLTEGPKIDDDIGGLSWVEATHYEPAMTDAWANLERTSIIQVVLDDPKSIPKNAEWKEKMDVERKSKMIALHNSRRLYLECAQ